MTPLTIIVFIVFFLLFMGLLIVIYKLSFLKTLYKSTINAFLMTGTLTSLVLVLFGIALITSEIDIEQALSMRDVSGLSDQQIQHYSKQLQDSQKSLINLGTALTIGGSVFLTLFLSFLVPILSALDQDKVNSELENELKKINQSLEKLLPPIPTEEIRETTINNSIDVNSLSTPKHNKNSTYLPLFIGIFSLIYFFRKKKS